MTTVIAISGRKGSGKGSICKFLTTNARNIWGEGTRIEVFSLAGPFKRMCVDFFGLDPALVYGTNEEKNGLCPYHWEDLPHYPVLCAQRWFAIHGDRDYKGSEILEFMLGGLCPHGPMTGRQFMQEMATGTFRAMCPDIHVKATFRAIDAAPVDIALCDDVRFPNEVEAFLSRGHVFRLLRAPHREDEHESETALDDFPAERYSAVIPEGTVVEQNQRTLAALVAAGAAPTRTWDDIDFSVCL
jgi:hypothetical protein